MKKKSVCRVGTVLAASILAVNMGNTATKSVFASSGQWRAYSLSVDAQSDFLYGDFDFDAEDEEDYPEDKKSVKDGKSKNDWEDETEDKDEAQNSDEEESEDEEDYVEAEPVPAPEEPDSFDDEEGSGDFEEESSDSSEAESEESEEPDADEAESSGEEDTGEQDGGQADADQDAEPTGEAEDSADASGENAEEAEHTEMSENSGDAVISETNEENGNTPETKEEQAIGAAEKDTSVSPGMNNMIDSEQSSTDAVPDAVAVTEEPQEETVGAAVAGRNTTSAENTVNTSSPGRASVMTQPSTYSSPGATQLIGNTDRKYPVKTSSSPTTGTVSGGNTSSSSSGSSSSGSSSSGSSSSGSSSSGRSSSGSSSSGKSTKSSGSARTAPKTGDTSNVFLHFSSAAASLGLIFESFLQNERRKHRISRKNRDK